MSFQLPRLYPIVDTETLRRHDFSPVAMAEALLEAGAEILQFRHKDAWTEPIFQQARAISDLARSAQATFVVNDRADYAAILNTAVHVGQDDLPPAAVRRVIGSGTIGFSTHNESQLVHGDSEDVQYLAIGPIYQTSSKRDPDACVGQLGLRDLRRLTRKPLVAIGGITLQNAREVLAAGADSVASIAGLIPPKCTRDSVRKLAAEWLELLSST